MEQKYTENNKVDAGKTFDDLTLDEKLKVIMNGILAIYGPQATGVLCSYCNHRQPDMDAMKAHMHICEHHPMGVLKVLLTDIENRSSDYTVKYCNGVLKQKVKDEMTFNRGRDSAYRDVVAALSGDKSKLFKQLEEYNELLRDGA